MLCAIGGHSMRSSLPILLVSLDTIRTFNVNNVVSMDTVYFNVIYNVKYELLLSILCSNLSTLCRIFSTLCRILSTPCRILSTLRNIIQKCDFDRSLQSITVRILM